MESSDLRAEVNSLPEPLLVRHTRPGESLVETLLHRTPIGIAHLDRDLRYVWVNATLAAMNGIPAEEHVGRTPGQLLPDIDPAAVDAMRAVLETGRAVVGYEFGGETPAEPGVHRYWLEAYEPILDERGEVEGVAAIVVEITGRRRNEQRVTQLQAITEALASAVTPAEVGQRAVEFAVGTLAAAGATFVVPEDAQTARISAFGGTTNAVVGGWQQFPISIDVPAARVVRTGQPYFASSRRQYLLDFPALDSAAEQTGLESVAVVPVPLEDATRGALAVVFREPHVFDDDEQGWAVSLGRLCGQALARARLAERDAQIRQRTETIAQMSAALSAAREPGEVADIILTQGLAALGARYGAILLDTGEGEVKVVGAVGRTDAIGRRGTAPRRSIVADALQRGQPIFVGSDEEFTARYPGDAATRDSRGGVAALPLNIEERTIGVMVVAFDATRAFPTEERSFMETLAGTCGQALDRARVYELERRGRERAERLAAIIAALADAPDARRAAEETLAQTAEIFGAANAALYRVDGDEVELLGANGYPESFLGAFRRYPLSARTRVADAIRAGKRVIIDGADAYRRRYPELAAITGANESSIAVPLIVRRRRIGALSLGFEGRRTWAPDELDFLAAVSEAAAQAVDRASLRDAERNTRRMLESVVRQMPVAVIVADAEGRLLEANDAVLQIWGGYRPSPAIDDYDNWRGFHPDGHRLAAEEWALARSIRLGEVVTNEEVEIERFDGARATIVNNSAPIRDEAGRIVGGVVVFIDVTAAREAALARDAFFGVLSHELRTPVTSILGGALLLQRDASLSETATELLDGVASDAERLQRLVENLLVLARVERGAAFVEPEPMVLQHLVRRVVEAEAAARPEAKVTLEIGPQLPLVAGDESYTEQVVRNLVSNAAKYGNGTILVALEGTPAEAIVRVVDDGPGFEPESGDDLFRLFYRAPDAARRASGAGIGLFVVRQLVEGMGGRVWAINRTEGGAEFGFALPVLAASEA